MAQTPQTTLTSKPNILHICAMVLSVTLLLSVVIVGVELNVFTSDQAQGFLKVTFDDIAESAGMTTEQLNTTLNSLSYEINPLYLSTSSAYNYTIHPLSDRIPGATIYYVMAADNGTLAYSSTNKTKVEQFALGNMTTAGRILCKNFAHNYSLPITARVSLEDNVNGTVRVFCNVADSTGSPYTISVDNSVAGSTYYVAQDSVDRIINSWSSTDATAVMQNALNSMTTGGAMKLSAGRFPSSGIEVKYSNTTIEGEGEATEIVATNTNNMIHIGNTSATSNTYTLYGLHFRDFTLNGNGTAYRGFNFYMDGTHNPAMQGSIENMYIQDVDDQAIRLNSVTQYQLSKININNYATVPGFGCTQIGIFFEVSGGSVTLTQSQIGFCQYGVYFDGGYDVAIGDSGFYYNNVTDVYATNNGISRLTIENSHFRGYFWGGPNCTRAIYLGGSTRYTVIMGNTFSEYAQEAIVFDNAALCVFSHNVIQDVCQATTNTYSAIKLTSSNYNTISFNTLMTNTLILPKYFINEISGGSNIIDHNNGFGNIGTKLISTSTSYTTVTDCFNYNPLGVIANAFNNTEHKIRDYAGGSAAPLNGTEYLIVGSPKGISWTGGTMVAIYVGGDLVYPNSYLYCVPGKGVQFTWSVAPTSWSVLGY